MKRVILCLSFLLPFLYAPKPAFAYSPKKLFSELERVSNNLGNMFRGKELKLENPITAVLEFSTSQKLKKKKVGIVLADMMTHFLTKSNVFTVVERERIEKVFEEQKLGLTGLISDESVAKVGNVLGAKLILLGSVNRIMNSYQINFRLVESETTKVIATDYLEVPVTVFDIEAKSYIDGLDEYFKLKKNQVILLGGYSSFLGDLSDIISGTTHGGLGYRRSGNIFGIELFGEYSSFTTKTNSQVSVAKNMDLLSGTISGLYYFGKPFQIRGYGKLGGGSSYSKVEASSINLNETSRDPLFIFGLGIDFSSNQRVGGMIELSYKHIFLKGTDIKSVNVSVGLNSNW